MAQYLLILHGNHATWDTVPQATQDEIKSRYNAFAKGLAEKGKLKGGDACQDGSYWVAPSPQGLKVDGPRQGQANAITGWFHFEADTAEQALGIARECPALTHGDSVELVPLGHTTA